MVREERDVAGRRNGKVQERVKGGEGEEEGERERE